MIWRNKVCLQEVPTREDQRFSYHFGHIELPPCGYPWTSRGHTQKLPIHLLRPHHVQDLRHCCNSLLPHGSRSIHDDRATRQSHVTRAHVASLGDEKPAKVRLFVWQEAHIHYIHVTHIESIAYTYKYNIYIYIFTYVYVCNIYVCNLYIYIYVICG